MKLKAYLPVSLLQGQRTEAEKVVFIQSQLLSSFSTECRALGENESSVSAYNGKMEKTFWIPAILFLATFALCDT